MSEGPDYSKVKVEYTNAMIAAGIPPPAGEVPCSPGGMGILLVGEDGCVPVGVSAALVEAVCAACCKA